MCGSAVGTGGDPCSDVSEEGVGAVAGEPRRDDDGAGADELIGGSELVATAEDEVTGALGRDLAEAVGLSTWGDVEVQALKHSTAPTTSGIAQLVDAITKAEWRGRRRTPRRIRSAIRRHWPSGTRSAYPFLRPSR